MEVKGEEQGVVVCPGPNLAYFDKEVSLSEMVRHIYGNGDVLSVRNRPNMFINELKMYVQHLREGIAACGESLTSVQQKKWKTFRDNLYEGIAYYEEMFANTGFFWTEINVINRQLRIIRICLQRSKSRTSGKDDKALKNGFGCRRQPKPFLS
ncbi:hypothetical protein [Chryseobacterium camelliae]|uniref:hypothetical protein n=1 Tax=Chryseobacterium camelliae TaxID=1265445 RepID=UPI0030010AEE